MLFRKKKEEEKIPTVHDQKMLDYSSELYTKRMLIEYYLDKAKRFWMLMKLFPEDSEYIEEVKADFADNQWAVNDACASFDKLLAEAQVYLDEHEDECVYKHDLVKHERNGVWQAFTLVEI